MKKQIAIGYDAKRILRNRTGLGNYGRTLVSDIAHANISGLSLHLYAPDTGIDTYRRQIALLPHTFVHTPPHSSIPVYKAYWRSKGILTNLKNDKINLFHGLSGELPLGISHTGIKSLVTIHDLIFMRHPEFYPLIDRKIYTWKFKQAIAEADHIIAISQRTKSDIIQLGDVDPTKITVVYQSCGAKFHDIPSPQAIKETQIKYNLPQRYILNVGTIEERKNILLAVRALHDLPAEVHLVIVGRSTPYVNKIQKYLSQNKTIAQRVHLLHGVEDTHLAVIYNQAEAFVYPSRYEGFGIPIIEAIHCGLPVVACTGSCLEEAGGDHCLYVNPDDIVGMSDALKHVLKGCEGRETRISKSLEYVRRFENTNVADQMIEIYSNLITQ